MTAMLNWYRASTIIVPAMDETPTPAWLDAPFPPVTQPTLVIWGLGDKALLPSQLEGLDARGRRSPRHEVREIQGISCRGRSPRR